MSDMGSILIGLSLLINAIFSIVTFFITHKLEKNTNSIKDALVKVTAESEHAKGVLKGTEDEKAAEQKRKELF